MSQQMIGFDVVYIITWPDFRYLDVGDILQYMELMGKKWQDVLAPRVLREGLYNEKDEQKHATHGW